MHQLKPKNLKPKHIQAVVAGLRAGVESGVLTIGSAKNWLSHLRAYVRLIDRPYLVPRTNAETGVWKPRLRALREQGCGADRRPS